MKLLRKYIVPIFISIITSINIAHADSINFNNDTDGIYFAPNVQSNGYIVTGIGATNIGTMSNFDGSGSIDGSVYLGVWNNSNLTTDDVHITGLQGQLFSAQSFTFDNAYNNINQNNTADLTTSITVEGLNAQGGIIASETFSPLGNVSQWTTYLLSNSFVGLSSLEFISNGSQNVRTLYDNITINNQNIVAQVPEPTSIALLAMGALGFGASRRKKNQA